MRIFAVDKNNDLFLGPDRHLALNTELAALMQTCEHVMQSILGEMVFSAGRGLPYMETVWKGSPNLRLFDDAARECLSAVQGVNAVTSFSSEIAGNTLRYRVVISSVYGEFSLSGNGGGNV